jgi:hypothetical protein
VCASVCMPAKFESDAKSDYVATINIVEWRKRVPKLQNFVASAQLENDFLVLDLTQAVNDIFVEGIDRFYFQAPDFSKQAGKAWIKIQGLKNEGDVRGKELRLTANLNGLGLEQRITVA